MASAYAERRARSLVSGPNNPHSAGSLVTHRDAGRPGLARRGCVDGFLRRAAAPSRACACSGWAKLAPPYWVSGSPNGSQAGGAPKPPSHAGPTRWPGVVSSAPATPPAPPRGRPPARCRPPNSPACRPGVLPQQSRPGRPCRPRPAAAAAGSASDSTAPGNSPTSPRATARPVSALPRSRSGFVGGGGARACVAGPGTPPRPAAPRRRRPAPSPAPSVPPPRRSGSAAQPADARPAEHGLEQRPCAREAGAGR